jgi:hypothetical protein
MAKSKKADNLFSKLNTAINGYVEKKSEFNKKLILPKF